MSQVHLHYLRITVEGLRDWKERKVRGRSWDSEELALTFESLNFLFATLCTTPAEDQSRMKFWTRI